MGDVHGHPVLMLRVRTDQRELAELRLWELGATGLEERDQETIVREPIEGDVVIFASFDDEGAARHALDEVKGEYESDLVFLPHQEWATEWRRGFGAQRIGRRILLRPSWEPVEGGPTDVVLTIDPENAFGSGDHETTRLVLRLIDELIVGGERVLDVGCGSGILSVAALRLGASSVVAIDIEEDVIEVAKRNAELNGVAFGVAASTRPLEQVEGRYDFVLANIETRVLVRMPSALQARMAPGASLILSGILRSERDQLLAAYESMKVDKELEEGEWYACRLVQAAS